MKIIVNKVFTQKDYEVVFYDPTIYIQCKTHILDFFATQEERLELIQCGADAVKEYVKNQNVMVKRRQSI